MIRFFLFFIFLFFISCNKNVLFSEYKKFDHEEWKRTDTATFNIEIKDTHSLYNLYLNIRHADGYPFNNLYVFVRSRYPDGTLRQDTVEIILADSRGKWFGDGMGDIFDFRAPLKENFRFTHAGLHTLQFIQAMRPDPLPLIMELGVEVKKAE